MFPDLDASLGIKLVAATIVVGLALVAFALAARAWRGRVGPGIRRRGGRDRQPRLAVVDSVAVDQRRRLLLIRRDDVEHLVMVGGPGDLIVESGIPAATHAADDEIVPASRERVADTDRQALPANGAARDESFRSVAASSDASQPEVRERRTGERREAANRDENAFEPAPLPQDVAGVLESQRSRVFGSNEDGSHMTDARPGHSPAPVHAQAYAETESFGSSATDTRPRGRNEPGDERRERQAPDRAFEDVLSDANARQARAGSAPNPKPEGRERTASKGTGDERDDAVDAEMSKLLGEITNRR
ncbi:flagellar biosynthetic protein FliO [Pararhizobium mangrovi]|nr:flagellar biosynthetic protein FliO [Pararhizobium mangrovi]